MEQALIGALAQRYPPGQPVDPAKTKAALIAYADAMKTVAQKFPQDLDVQTFYAEALMNTNAWKLWTPDHRAAPGTDIIVATLESVLARDPAHPGANHYYVHAIEGLASSGESHRLRGTPEGRHAAAGHLVHMPAHIMQRIGRYEEAAEANRRAAVADEAYARSTQAPDYYVMYTAHNYQFLAYSTAMQGRKVETLAAADNSRKVISDDMLLAMPGADWYVAEIYSARIRFGLWDDMLAMPAPNPKLPGIDRRLLVRTRRGAGRQGPRGRGARRRRRSSETGVGPAGRRGGGSERAEGCAGHCHSHCAGAHRRLRTSNR